MSDTPQMVRTATVVDAITEARIMDYHGNLEDDLLPPRITRAEVNAEVSHDLLTAAMQGAL